MRPLDWIVIAVYVSAVIGMGIWYGRRQRNLEDYFLGGHSIPWWAALMSLIATEISAATFLGAPEQGYTRDLTYLEMGIGTILARIALAYLFIGVYYRFNVYTVYGYLRSRFGLPTNSLTAGIFLLGRFFADGSRLFIAALAIQVATGLPLTTAIVVLAAAATAYTLFGGIKGVIFTEVVQATVLVSGALILIVSLAGHIPIGLPQIVSELADAEKFRLLDFRLTTPTGGFAPLVSTYHVLPAILGGFFLTMATHGTDQDMVQRLLTCKDSASGKRSLWMSGFLGIGITCLFITVGMLLFIYVRHLPATDQMAVLAGQLKDAGKNNQFLIHYIIRMLPAGVTGLVLAALVAAALSSLGSALNATSSTAVTDFYQQYVKPQAEPGHYVTVSRLVTCGIGSVVVGVGLLCADFSAHHPEVDLLSIALGSMTFFYGALLGIFLVGLFSKTRGNTMTNIVGALTSIALAVVLKFFTPVAYPWFIVLGTAVTAGISLLGRTPEAVLDAHHAAGVEADRQAA